MDNFKLLVIHLGGVANHIIYKARLILRNIDKHCIIICESPVDHEDFAKIGVKTSKVMPKDEDIKTEGTIDDIEKDPIANAMNYVNSKKNKKNRNR